MYITWFIEWYADTKVEWVWDLYEQALNACQKDPKIKLLYYIVIDFEENFGFSSKVFSLFEDCISKVKDDEKLEVVNFNIAKAAQYNGVSRVR